MTVRPLLGCWERDGFKGWEIRDTVGRDKNTVVYL